MINTEITYKYCLIYTEITYKYCLINTECTYKYCLINTEITYKYCLINTEITYKTFINQPIQQNKANKKIKKPPMETGFSRLLTGDSVVRSSECCKSGYVPQIYGPIQTS